MDASVKREIRKASWNGHVPVCFRLAQKDSAGIETPLPLYAMLPRLSYFPMVFDRVKAHFLGVVPTAVDEIWLDCNGTPLRWHFAVGVLFDLHNDSLLPPIPWQITVHFSSFPEDRLIRLTGVEALKTIFMSSLKAANFLKFGDGGKVMSLSRVDQDNLWLSIGQTEAGQFWEVGDKLLNEPLKSVAFRFFSTGSESFVQRQIRPVNEDGSAKTLGQALDELGYKTKLPKIQGILVPLETNKIWKSVLDVQMTLQHCDSWVYVLLT